MIVVEIHVPMLPAPGVSERDYPYPWINDIEDFLAEEDHEYDDGEQVGDVYVFFATGGTEEVLLEVAARAVALPRVPRGAFAVISHDEAPELGVGRRVNLPVT
ncbi:hypothetical protein [Asanoa siamensis]|uniref:Uncharacterized protein n=1 Tax=Asanoa siamensis TaxID=926357 RepID=A0ABQ4CTR3_9ACTN|nr:hypothetical protein [Asanoa siamensis]GIF74658.1 hypothetical protein Asi02nite_41760 [Asanoa siamensis]